MVDRDAYILWQFLKALLYDYNLHRKWITLYCWSKIVVCCSDEMSLYKWGWCVWKDVEWAILSLPTAYAAVHGKL